MVGGGWYVDTDVRDGWMILSRPHRETIALSQDTMRHVFWSDELRAHLSDLVQHMEPGLYELPEQFQPVPEEVVDLLQGLVLAERWAPNELGVCQYGPCILAGDHRHAGYQLCWFHDEMLTGHERHLVA